MSCRQIRSQLPEYVRDQQPAVERREVRAHLESCESCRQHEVFEQLLMEQMASQCAVPPPSLDFESRVLRAATTTSSAKKVHAVWGGAVAAALVIGLMIGQGMPVSEPELAELQAPAEQTSVAAVQPVNRTVRLAFTAGEPLDDVTLTLALPPHVELSGLPGQHKVSWQVSLQQGDNVLALPLTILFPGAGELVAELDANGRQKVFRAMVPQHPDIDEPATMNKRINDEEPAT
ncbi:zf-HC2 domain-containing protein [Marinobacter sp.]|uniref:zf-HC2 domain-containing protein n=1 Tax=Marinobacter sp. TaxID=50741 RepID=UPI0025BA5F98|nr:zf-HC2 domain-containing protein [Marinobacter sp.]